MAVKVGRICSCFFYLRRVNRGCASNGSTGDTSRASELSGLQRTSRACAFLCAAACISHGRHGSKLAAKSGGLMAPRKPGQSRGV